MSFTTHLHPYNFLWIKLYFKCWIIAVIIFCSLRTQNEVLKILKTAAKWDLVALMLVKKKKSKSGAQVAGQLLYHTWILGIFSYIWSKIIIRGSTHPTWEICFTRQIVLVHIYWKCNQNKNVIFREKTWLTVHLGQSDRLWHFTWRELV